jgi:hypothetical protein
VQPWGGGCYCNEKELGENFRVEERAEIAAPPASPPAPLYRGVFPTPDELGANAVSASRPDTLGRIHELTLRRLEEMRYWASKGQETSVTLPFNVSSEVKPVIASLAECGWYAEHHFDTDEGHWLTVQDSRSPRRELQPPQGEAVSGKELLIKEYFWPRSGSNGGIYLALSNGERYRILTSFKGGYFIAVPEPKRQAFIRADEVAANCEVVDAVD